MSSLVEIAEGLAAALQPLRDNIEDLQIYPYFLLNPTPPAIDIYPGDPFQSGSGFGPAEKNLFWTVRARWTTADHDASQQGLLSLLDPTGLEAALYADDTLGGVVSDVFVGDDSPSGYREYISDSAINGRLLGAEWRVQVIMSANGTAPPAATVPAAPTLTSAAPDDSAVTLAWTPHATGGSPITGYKIYRGTSTGTETLLTTVAVVTVFLDDTVTNDTAYFYKVAAANTVGESAMSNELSATPTAGAPPAGLSLLDDFNRANSGTLGTNWTGSVTSVETGVFQIVSNTAARTAGSSEQSTIWNPTLFTDDQAVSAQTTWPSGPTGFKAHYLLLQVTGTAAGAGFTGYLFNVSYQATPYTANLELYRAVGGSFTQLGAAVSGQTFTDGDTWEARKEGSVLTLSLNGVSVLTRTDGSPVTGSGNVGFGTSDPNVRFDDFKGGNL